MWNSTLSLSLAFARSSAHLRAKRLAGLAVGDAPVTPTRNPPANPGQCGRHRFTVATDTPSCFAVIA
jgi:hypothetical protein